ncbi:MAG: prepilin peptidase [Solirubrobacteraceae bacterium]|nr:prepilin peptidase [Patulibacter sp.]
MLAAIVLALIAGLAIGSFLNVVIYRVPRGESVVSPRSRCPHCGHEITAIENVPVFSWLALRGRCRSCKEPISWRYPAIELLTGVLYAGVVAVRFDDGAQIALGLILATALVPITFIDLEFKRIPNVITYPTAVALIVAGCILDLHGEPERLLAAAIVVAPFLLLTLVLSRSMGMGDVKLMGVLGLGLGRALAPGLFFAFISGTLVGVGLMLRFGMRARKTAVPFGPFLAAGGVFAFCFGASLWDSYVDTFHH